MNGFDLSNLGRPPAPPPSPAAPPQAPPFDPANPYLGWSFALVHVTKVELGEDPERPNVVQAVPGEARMATGRTKVVILTVRNPSTTMTVFLEAARARHLLDDIRDVLAEMPLIITPPAGTPGAAPFLADVSGLAPAPVETAERRRLELHLETPDGETRATLDAARATALVGILERAVAALSGLTLG